MTINGWVQIALYCVLLTLLVKPFGGYMTRVFNGDRTFLGVVLRPVETVLYRISGVRENEEQHWVVYAVAMLLFSVAGFVSLYALQRLQAVLPFNPQRLDRGEHGPRVQHFDQLHHQHKLAVLHAGKHHELPGRRWPG